MAKKRFTDIEIWDREWYMDLSPTHKCLIKYIFDKCDAAGCWKPNWKLASLHINDKVSLHDLSLLPKDQYEVLPNGKIYIPDFVKFQYGTLSEKSPAHNPVFSAIDKNGLSDRVFNRVQSSPKDKDKEKDKEKEEEEVVKKTKKPTMPIAKDFNGLPDIKIIASIELVRITKQHDINKKNVQDMWEVFKIQNLTGEKYYANEEDVYSHFINWIKTQNFKEIKKDNATSVKKESEVDFEKYAKHKKVG